MIYALVGPETYLVDRAFAKLRQRLLVGVSPFNHETFDAGTASLTAIRESLGQVPLLGGRRVVLVKGVEAWSTKDLKSLEGCVETLPEDVDWILIGGKVDRRHRLWQLVEQKGKLREFKPLFPREVPAWIRQDLKDHGYRIQPEALTALAEIAGTEMGVIGSTLEKLFLHLGERREVTLEDVQVCAGLGASHKIFEINDAVGQRQPAQALKLYRSLSASGESSVALLALLIRHFRILRKIKRVPHLSAQQAGVAPFFWTRYLEQAARFQEEEMERNCELMFHADWALKSSPLPEPEIMESLLWKLCR